MAEYLHPSVSSRVVDNSFVYTTATGTTKLFQVIRAGIGPDNVLTRLTSPDEALFRFGTPNLGNYGQGLYNVTEWLGAGGEAYALRVLPADARYANLLLSVVTGATGAKTLTVKATSLDAGVSSKAALKNILSSNNPEIGVPLAFFIPKGRGAGYNGYGMRLTLRNNLDKTYDFRTYDLTFTGKDSTGADVQIEGPFLVSLDPEAKNKANESVYYASVVNKYSRFFDVVDNRKGFETVAGYVVGEDSEDLSKVDILYGVERKVATAETVHTGLTMTQTSLDLGDVNYLRNGFDGTWSGANTVEALMTNAYSGLIDPAVLDKLQYEFDVVLDANYGAPVKNAMSDFAAVQREDCIAVLDCGIQADAEGTIEYRQNSISMSNYYTAIFGQSMDVFDSFNGETITVTSTYFLASLIPAVDNSHGLQWPFVGPRRGVISGFDNINFFPNEAWKESLYEAKINYIEKDPKKVNFASQLTSQAQNSALSQISNVRVLLKIRREVTKMMADYRQEFNDSTTYDSMSYSVNNYLQTWVANRALSSASASVYASDYDKQQNLVRVSISVVFNGIIERVAIDININR